MVSPPLSATTCDALPRASSPATSTSFRHCLIDSLLPLRAKRAKSSDQDQDDDEMLVLADHPTVQQAQVACQSLQNGNSVTILEDDDVHEDVVQLVGSDVEMQWTTHCIYRYLVLFLKDLGTYVACDLEILDDQQHYRSLQLTNARSLATIESSHCQLPLVLGSAPSWRYVCIDLQDLTHTAFGTKHVATTHVRITGYCRLLRVFFQDERYADCELPPELTFLGA